MIELGLARITRLLKDTQTPWRAIHVAGTNGKGSVCAYASAMLNAGNISCGRFTSPHLIDRWDCITINEKSVNEDFFREVETVVKTKDQSEDIKASEFEILTATAFEIFNREKIEIGVVEVGLGGLNDATNVLEHPAVTVITKIGKDHQFFLGSTLEEIALHKAGIMKNGVHCIADGSNTTEVLEVLKMNAAEVGATSLLLVPQDADSAVQVRNVVAKDELMDHQQMNLYLAFEAVKEVLAHCYPSLDPLRLLPSIPNTVPGRLQNLNIRSLTDNDREILIDGAHNSQSAEVLGTYVDQRLREKHRPVTWMIAMSKGKDIQELLHCLLRSGDNLVAVDFGPVDGMPWVCPEEADSILSAARGLGNISDCSQTLTGNLAQALQLAVQISDGGPLVAAGSLYLVSDVLRLWKHAELMKQEPMNNT
ncbi:MAG: hypothetical protein Q9175_004489 [Cornicularia normoerica]